jgi:hypothetical protein
VPQDVTVGAVPLRMAFPTWAPLIAKVPSLKSAADGCPSDGIPLVEIDVMN